MTDHELPVLPTPNEGAMARPVQIPERVIPPHLVAGVYANQAFQIGTNNEVVLDFSVAVPDRLVLDEKGEVSDITIAHQLVSRVIMPIDQFVSFIVACATRNPTIQKAVIASAGDPES